MTIQEAIKQLRSGMGLSQEGLARHLNLTVRTIARYENDSPPGGRALRQFIQLAKERGQDELQDVFYRALEEEFGLNAVRQITDFRIEVGRATAKLLAIVNDENLTKEKAQEIGRVVISDLRALETRLAALDPY